MKVLTLHQPWASLVALGVKMIETRSWSTAYRGPLAIHAGARRPHVGLVGHYGVIPVHEVARDKYPGSEFCLWSEPGWVPLPLGAIVATCMLVDVVPMVAACAGSGQHLVVDALGLTLHAGYTQTTVENERPYGLFEPGRSAWLLADVVPVDPPIPFKGGQGLTRTWEP